MKLEPFLRNSQPTSRNHLQPETPDNSSPNQNKDNNTKNNESKQEYNTRNKAYQKENNADVTDKPIRKSVAILGDSMVKDIMPHRFLPKLAKTSKISISGVTSGEILDYAVPSIKRKVDYFIIHCGAKDLMLLTCHLISKNIFSITNIIKESLLNTKVFISSIIKRGDKPFLNNRINQVNDILNKESESRGYCLINNDNIEEDDLNGSMLHLSKRGTSKLALNIIQNIKPDLLI